MSDRGAESPNEQQNFTRRTFLKGAAAGAGLVAIPVRRTPEVKAQTDTDPADSWKTPEIMEVEGRLGIELTRISDNFDFVYDVLKEAATEEQVRNLSIDWSTVSASGLEKIYSELPDSFRTNDKNGNRRKVALINYPRSMTLSKPDDPSALICLSEKVFGENSEYHDQTRLRTLTHESIHYERHKNDTGFDNLISEAYSFSPQQMNEHLIGVLSDLADSPKDRMAEIYEALVTYGAVKEDSDGYLVPRDDSEELESVIGEAYVLAGGQVFDTYFSPYFGENTQRIYSHFKDGMFEGWEYPRFAQDEIQ